jgi:hypothetical protein
VQEAIYVKIHPVLDQRYNAEQNVAQPLVLMAHARKQIVRVKPVLRRELRQLAAFILLLAELIIAVWHLKPILVELVVVMPALRKLILMV